MATAVADPDAKEKPLKFHSSIPEKPKQDEIETTEAPAVRPKLDLSAIKEASKRGATLRQLVETYGQEWEVQAFVDEIRRNGLVVRFTPEEVKEMKKPHQDKEEYELDWERIDKMLKDSYTNDQIYEQYGKEMDFEAFMNAVEERKEELKLNTVPKNQRTRDTNMSNRLSEGATHGSGPSQF